MLSFTHTLFSCTYDIQIYTLQMLNTVSGNNNQASKLTELQQYRLFENLFFLWFYIK